jgi:hypothetical protein
VAICKHICDAHAPSAQLFRWSQLCILISAGH